MNNAHDAHKMSFISKISGTTKGMHSANKNAFIMFKRMATCVEHNTQHSYDVRVK